MLVGRCPARGEALIADWALSAKEERKAAPRGMIVGRER